MTQLSNPAVSVTGGKVWTKPKVVKTPHHIRTIFISLGIIGLTAATTGVLLILFWVPTLFSHKVADTKTFLITQPEFPYILWLLILVLGGLGLTAAGLIGCFPFLHRIMESVFVVLMVPVILFCLPTLIEPIYEQNNAFATWLSHDNGLKPMPSNDKTRLTASDLSPSDITNNKPLQMVNQKNEIVDVTFTVTPGKIQIKNITPASTPNLG